jgi:hypothetical protein
MLSAQKPNWPRNVQGVGHRPSRCRAAIPGVGPIPFTVVVRVPALLRPSQITIGEPPMAPIWMLN